MKAIDSRFLAGKTNQRAKFGAACVVVALTLLTGLIAGCTSGHSSAGATTNSAKYYAVTAEKAAFFKYGPQQGNGPDTNLSKDTLVTLIHSSWGYSKVKLLNGEQGYVSSDEIHIASPNLIAAANAPTTPAGSPEVHGEHFNINSGDPRLIPPPEPLPDSSPVMPVEPDPLQQ